MGIFSNGPLGDQELRAIRVEYIPEPPKPRRNVTTIIATRVCDGEVFTFHGWQEIERIGFSRMGILASIAPNQHGSFQYEPKSRPYEGFRWRVIGPKDHPIPPDTYMPIY